MTTFDAHASFCIRPDGGLSLLTDGCDEETAPLFCTALASLSGQLSDAKSQEDLNGAVSHAFTLLSIGTVDQNDLHREVQAVLNEVCEFGEAVDEATRRLVELN